MRHLENNETTTEDIEITAGTLRLPATLQIPPRARGLVVFAHGSGSSRFSSRNRQVAAALAEADVVQQLAIDWFEQYLVNTEQRNEQGHRAQRS